MANDTAGEKARLRILREGFVIPEWWNITGSIALFLIGMSALVFVVTMMLSFVAWDFSVLHNGGYLRFHALLWGVAIAIVICSLIVMEIQARR